MAYDHLEIEARWGTILGEGQRADVEVAGQRWNRAGQAVRKFVYVPGQS
jgi:hypothetical protein